MSDKETFEQVKDAAVGDSFLAPVNLFGTLHDKVGIDSPQHPAYYYIQVWTKIAPGVWLLSRVEHVSSFEFS